MAKGIGFNFGANRKPKKTSAGKSKGKKASKNKKGGSKSNAWRQYVSSNAPIPD